MKSNRFGKVISFIIISLLITVIFVPFTAEGRLKRNWSRNYGGEYHDIAYEVLLSEDGGYLLVGYSNSVSPNKRYQVFIVKTNSNGYTEWTKDIGGDYSDRAFAATKTADGGYAIAGSTTSYGGRDNEDFYLIKIDNEGNLEWENNFGGDHNEIAYDVIQTSDGGYILVGTTVTFGHKGTDWWIVKTDANGEKEWSRYYGGQQDEACTALVETEQGDFVLGGYTASYGDPGYGLWALKIDEDKIDKEKIDEEGEMQGIELEQKAIIWETNVGGFLDDKIYDLIVTQDGGYAATGETRSYTETGSNFWLVKLDSEGKEEWNNSYGGDFEEVAYSLIQTPEETYMMAGYETSYGGVQEDIFVVEADENGDELFRYETDADRTDIAYSIIMVNEETFAVAGKTRSYGAGGFSFYLVEFGRPTEISVPYMIGSIGIGIVALYFVIKIVKKYRYKFKLT
ncbi:MAG: hypothetical protein ACOC85_00200 [Thermoplasmatota archaeon]